MTTARTIIESALRKINVIGVGQALSAEEANDALIQLNAMIDSWSVEGWNNYTQVRESFPLTAQVASYTIGSGATFDTSRPVRIIAAFIRQTGSDIDYPLALISADTYANSDKLEDGTIPEALYYDGNFPLGTIILLGAPTAGYELHLYSYKENTQFTTLNTDIDLPPGMEQALVYSLAVYMAPEYEKEAYNTVKAEAIRSKKVFKVANTRNEYNQADIDPTAGGSKATYFDVLTGYR